jgi:hypothetical protein
VDRSKSQRKEKRMQNRLRQAGLGARVRFGIFAIAVGASVLSAPACAAEPWPSVGANDNAAAKAIVQALAKPVRLEFIETPLEDVLAFLADQSRVAIQIDRRGLDNAGIGTDTPITKNLKEVSLRSALRLILDDLNLTFVVDHEVLLITAPDKAEAAAQVRIYNVAPLLRDGLTAAELAVALHEVLYPDLPLPPGASGGPAAPPAVGAGGMPGMAPDAAMGGGSSAVPGGRRIVPLKNLLLVRATTLGHEAAANLLAAIAQSLQEKVK